MDCVKCIQQQEKIIHLTHSHALYQKKDERKPNCYYCNTKMVKVFYNNAPNERAHIGYFCRNCNSYKMNKGLRVIA